VLSAASLLPDENDKGATWVVVAGNQPGSLDEALDRPFIKPGGALDKLLKEQKKDSQTR
jgi:hypothetical protein